MDIVRTRGARPPFPKVEKSTPKCAQGLVAHFELQASNFGSYVDYM